MRLAPFGSAALIALLASSGCVVKTGTAKEGRPPAPVEVDEPGRKPVDPGPDTIENPSQDLAQPPVEAPSEGPAPIDALRSLNQAINSENATELEVLIHPEWGVTTGGERFAREDLATKRLQGLPPKGHRMPERCPDAYTEGEATCTVDDRDGSFEIRFRLDGDQAYLVEVTKQ